MIALLQRIAARLPFREIRGDFGEPYLERYFVCALPFGGAVFLHRFLASDPDRGLHDHPWRWSIGIPLTRGYAEWRFRWSGGLEGGRKRWRNCRPFLPNLILGNTFHRILVWPGAEGKTWTLFVHGPRAKRWGFLRFDDHGRARFEPHTGAMEGDNWRHTTNRRRFA